MLISKQWLSEFVKLPPEVSDADLAKTVTLSTVEVEKTINQAAAMEHMVVGLVVAVLPHPNADRLHVCQVDVGGRVTQIVCGGINVVEGMKVAVALPGSRVRWHGEGELVELAKTKIRGEESEGMICAGAEIGIEKSDEGEHEIMDLSALDVTAGTPLAEALGRDDVVFDIEHKSLTNRPDLMGHYGMAREIAALYRAPLKAYAPSQFDPKKNTLKGFGSSSGPGVSVLVDEPELCPRYVAVLVEGITVGPSPAWVRNRLLSCGVRSINNVVDITNFVMLELGQPMHAFDADVVGEKIIVRRAKKREKIACLDDATYELGTDDLVVTDGKKPIAIAGVMGGKESGVTDATTRIVFESANFNPVSVRKTSVRLALRSESSARFEKSLDPNQCDLAMRRAVELVRRLCPEARVVFPVAEVYSRAFPTVKIEMGPEDIRRNLGADIPEEEMKDILRRLGFDILDIRKTSRWTVIVPTWRATKDVTIKEDVIEEVARIWGYDRIPSALPVFSIAPPPEDVARDLARRLRHALAIGHGATEAYRYAFVAPETLTALGFDPAEHLRLANPLAADRPYLVRSLLPNLLEAVAENHRAFESVSLFEIDRVFLGDAKGDEDGQGGTLPAQPYHAAIAYSIAGDERPFVALRGMVEAILFREGFGVSFGPATHPAHCMHSGRSADILVDGKKCGMLAELTPEASMALGIDRRVAVAELNVSDLASRPRATASFAPIPQFPDAKRDLAFVVSDRVAYADIESAIRGASPLLASVELFDVYRGKGVEEGKKSIAVHITLRSTGKTLSSDEVEAALVDARSILFKRLGAVPRA
ncbi:phenylalanine--tRNA ligase subunit beta [Candidatus Uhrbacteria bacterium RIFOXYB2_FULL_57_15]|uniref:Phenylalanine--tRNA ligase beta subunit n=1 Tax=Candidatus Uhrbacteria bacterium RIFOXYB2_FULL_57_15 TaxID=1802422 RepID=A0A1F7W9A4_9BACT|nr:MAG: phenylalanine--tRNA ligase subunit beta [Candidatus Uhrbacteria bacterium RIFOXYB2_FULL_57_15]OGM00011.1 MAG: phenylalanine--tRNA ligase subunit beta [Candidatus Uhrbacteria bacterium RIFOXYC12_FULL_57_11]